MNFKFNKRNNIFRFFYTRNYEISKYRSFYIRLFDELIPHPFWVFK